MAKPAKPTHPIADRLQAGDAKSSRRTICIGAGSVGHALAKELARSPDLGIEIVGFVDDDPKLQGKHIDDHQVLGTIDDLASVVTQTESCQALIAIASLSGEQVQRITAACEACDLSAKIIPPMHDLLDGKVHAKQIRDLRIEDLLGRTPMTTGAGLATSITQGKVVMVTGAGGSIGSELCRQILAYQPASLLLVEQSENGLYQIHRKLEPRQHNCELIPAIADICDAPRMRALFRDYRPDLVLHAAAHKQVPLMECNPSEAVKNNAQGTQIVADLASEFGAESFILISSDKAVHPTSVMGATKRIAEMYLQALQQSSRTRFVSVRFGNVLGSAGSVVPLFQEQIDQGGPVTVTHPEMARYFMTMTEACSLLLEAGSIGNGGDIFVLDMGKPIHITQLAEQMIRLSHLEPYTDIAIEFTGIRPGEKLFEELSFDDEVMLKTSCPKIFLHRPTTEQIPATDQISDIVDAAAKDTDKVRAHIHSLVKTYSPTHGTLTPKPRQPIIPTSSSKQTSLDLVEGKRTDDVDSYRQV
jgi:FlaA1/EpsC-like NDP-sugar epimerase